eukprot:Sspe_Gene.12171::Locus_4141_Transcript_1_1_Confidence_1.000_Length_704::g.12171::m.12171
MGSAAGSVRRDHECPATSPPPRVHTQRGEPLVWSPRRGRGVCCPNPKLRCASPGVEMGLAMGGGAVDIFRNSTPEGKTLTHSEMHKLMKHHAYSFPSPPAADPDTPRTPKGASKSHAALEREKGMCRLHFELSDRWKSPVTSREVEGPVEKSHLHFTRAKRHHVATAGAAPRAR